MPDQKHALVVGSQPGSLSVMIRLFAAEGFAVQPATTGREALKTLAERTFHVIATDHDMIPITGMDLWTLIRKEPRHETARFLLLTTTDHRERLAAKHPELPAILCKPFSAEALRKALNGEAGSDAEDFIEI
jgi:CheY-like chemotaxis protein